MNTFSSNTNNNNNNATSSIANRAARFGIDGGVLPFSNVPGVVENEFDRLEKERIESRKEYEAFVAKAGTGHVFRGTCRDFCPIFERHEREIHSDLSVFEMIPGTETPTQPGDYPRYTY